MATLKEIIATIEEIAPLTLQEEWDNSGWQVGPLTKEATAALLCVDVTPAVIDEAIERKCNLIISHHPLIFSGLKKINPDDATSGIIIKAIRHGISIYSSHTAMDRSAFGVSAKMCEKLNLKNCTFLDNPGGDAGLGMIGECDREYSEEEFLKKVKDRFGCQSIRYSDLCGRRVRKVAVCGGSGASFIEDAIRLDADIYVTADVKYHNYFTALGKLVVADIGHFESEQFTKEIFFDTISKKFPKFALLYSKMGISPVNSL